MPIPDHFSHVVLRSFDMQRLKDWYVKVFQMEIIVENERAAFATFDDEHHRFAFIQMPGSPTEEFRRPSTFAHGAYTFKSLDDLMEQYKHMKRLGLEPVKCVNHGPTVSLYYDDPDGNGIELFVDRFATMAETKQFMRSESFRKNMTGYLLDPEHLLKEVDAGLSDAEVMAYDQDAADAALAARPT